MVDYVEYWADYSGAQRTGDQVANTFWEEQREGRIIRHPITGVVRYIDDITNPEFYNRKHITKAEYDSLSKRGIKIRLVMQVNTKDSDTGFNGGVERARRAKRGADYLGYRDEIYFTNDRTELPNTKSWTDYLDGAASVLGRPRVGAYGFRNALNAALGHASAFWQAGRESELVPHANIYQWNNGRIYIAGLEADLNKVIRIYSPQAIPAPTTRIEEDMAVMGKAFYPSPDKPQEYVIVPCDGRRELFIAVGGNDTVDGIIYFIQNTPPYDGGQFSGPNMTFHIDGDRPGPLAIPRDTRAAIIGYTKATHDFTAWAA